MFSVKEIYMNKLSYLNLKLLETNQWETKKFFLREKTEQPDNTYCTIIGWTQKTTTSQTEPKLQFETIPNPKMLFGLV